MQLIATLGDAPTAAIAVVAILLGLLFAARGSRERRQAAGEAPGPSMLEVPVAAPESEPGFVGPAGEIVGHGTIRLGAAGQPAPAAEAPSWAVAPAPAAPPVVDAEPAAAAEPAPEGTAESTFPGQPEAVEPAPVEHVAAEQGAAEPAPAEPSEPAWRRHMPKANRFRQGTIKLGGEPAGKPPAD